ncbi:carboxypeptidase-like regulatory domain-containing protein [Methanosarcina horonobensis]|uniref:carboxypeptidase-like regulatory domain-containing protein n=1 Tax=Methanosarcina horonobensis TaxID=418008 RepID=UPI0022B8605A|nr:carboxypeptidase-like regulatory domain-containing protein [Methanosarcina horonobensis]
MPGVWGYVKNADTQAAIKSATVTVTNGSLFTEYLYTDSNGMYYLTKGISEGPYNLTAAKTGYTTSNPFLLTTTAGTTTRKDIFS